MLTPEKLKEARQDLGITQRTLGDAVGVHKTDISRFECGRFQLTSKQCRAIWDYLTEHLEHLREEGDDNVDGYEMEGFAPYEIDGIMIPDGFDLVEAEELMTRYRENAKQIRIALEQELERGFFGGIKMDALIHTLMIPMAENLSIVEQIHGQPGIEPRTADLDEPMDDLQDINTNRDALAYLIGRATYLKHLEESEAG